MVSSPRHSGLGGLLRAVNQGIGALGRRGGPAIDSDSSSEEEDSDKCKRLLGLPGQR